MRYQSRLAGVVVEYAGPDQVTTAYVDFETPEWEALLEWLRFHDIDPMRIPAPSKVMRDRAARRITYREFVFDEHGKPVVGTDGELVSRVVFQQGEAIAPLPEVVARCLR